LILRNKKTGIAIVSLSEDWTVKYNSSLNNTFIILGTHRIATISGDITKEAADVIVNSVWKVEDNFFTDLEHLFTFLGYAKSFELDGKTFDSFSILGLKEYNMRSAVDFYDSPIPILSLSKNGNITSFSENFFFGCDLDFDTLTLTSINGNKLKMITNDFIKKSFNSHSL